MNASLGADGERGDDDAFDELVRVGAQQGAVLERARLTFGAVADDESARPGLRRNARPFPSGGEASAAAAPKPGVEHGVDRCGGADLLGALDPEPAGVGGEVRVEGGDWIVGEEKRGHRGVLSAEVGRGPMGVGTGDCPEVRGRSPFGERFVRVMSDRARWLSRSEDGVRLRREVFRSLPTRRLGQPPGRARWRRVAGRGRLAEPAPERAERCADVLRDDRPERWVSERDHDVSR